MIVQELLLPVARGDNGKDAKGTPIVNSNMNLSVPHHMVSGDGSKVMSCYIVRIQNPLHFYYVISLLGAAFSFVRS